MSEKGLSENSCDCFCENIQSDENCCIPKAEEADSCCGDLKNS